MQKVKIIPLDETAYDHNVDNMHFNSIGSLCEIILDSLLNNRLRELMGEIFVGVESDFLYNVENDEITSFSLFINTKRNLSKEQFKLLPNALTTTLKELFKTDDVSLEVTDEKYLNAEWVFRNSDDMLLFMDKLNKMGIYTEKTLKVEYISD